jgi:hypothetical protein
MPGANIELARGLSTGLDLSRCNIVGGLEFDLPDIRAMTPIFLIFLHFPRFEDSLDHLSKTPQAIRRGLENMLSYKFAPLITFRSSC